VLVACKRIDKVVIDTDSPTVRDICAKDYPQVLVLERPEELRDGAIPMNRILLHDTEQVASEYYLQTHSTNPLMTLATVEAAIDTFLAQAPTFDSLFTVTKVQTRLWDPLTRAVNHNPNILLRTQDLPPLFEENSCLYIFAKNILLERQNRLGLRPYMLEMDPFEAIDIDNEINFQVAEAVWHATRKA
jgi:CMP-N-acetylneuraminic acid synthetase